MIGAFPFITLKSFPSGYTPYGKIKKLLREDYYNSLIKINDSQIEDIALYMNGVKLKEKLFETLSWGLFFNPIPELEIYFLCERDENRHNFSVVYSRNSIVVPTEDVYAFTFMYILILSKIAEGELSTNLSEIPKKFVSLNNFIKGKYQQNIKNFYKNLSFIEPKVLNRFPNVFYKKEKDGVVIFLYKILDDLFIKFKIGKEKDIAVTEKSLNLHGKEIVFTFIGLILNAFRRERLK